MCFLITEQMLARKITLFNDLPSIGTALLSSPGLLKTLHVLVFRSQHASLLVWHDGRMPGWACDHMHAPVGLFLFMLIYQFRCSLQRYTKYDSSLRLPYSGRLPLLLIFEWLWHRAFIVHGRGPGLGRGASDPHAPLGTRILNRIAHVACSFQVLTWPV